MAITYAYGKTIKSARKNFHSNTPTLVIGKIKRTNAKVIRGMHEYIVYYHSRKRR